MNDIATQQVQTTIASTRPRSQGIEAIKGLLILAVVIGHNEAFSIHAPWLRAFLYYFHTQCFLLMACGLDSAPFSVRFARDRAIRYLVPYGVFVLISIAAVRLLNQDGLVEAKNWRTLAISLLSGNETLLKDATGMRVFWFLPTLYTLVMLRALASSSGTAHSIVFTASLAWIACASLISPESYRAAPLGLPVALFFVSSGLTFRQAYLNAQTNPVVRITARWAMPALTAVLTALLLPLGSINASRIETYFTGGFFKWAVASLLPLTILQGLMTRKESLGRCLWLSSLGRNSLAIYLIHMFVYRATTRLLFGNQFADSQTVGASLPVGLLLLSITLGVSLLVANSINRASGLRRLVFPRDWDDWISRRPNSVE